MPRGVTMLALAVALWQSAEQRRREVEAADAASLARLVRGVFVVVVVVSGRGSVAAVFVATMCVLLWWWRDQASVGLGALRSPAVRKVASHNLVFGLLLLMKSRVVWCCSLCGLHYSNHC